MSRSHRLSTERARWRLSLIAAALALAGLALAASEAWADTGQAEPRLLRVGEVGTGELLLVTEKPGLFLQAPLVATDFDVTVSGAIARTTVTQHFVNPSEGWVEGIYVFPLPEGAAVDTLVMRIGDRVIQGQIKERGEARALYEQAKDDGKKASLIEQERPNIFTNSIANIGPRETVVVQIEYQESLRLDGGAMSLRLPLVVAPRYSPAATLTVVDFGTGETWGHVSDPVPDRDRIESPVLRPEQGKTNPVTLRVVLDAGFPLGEVESHHHPVTVTRDGDAKSTVVLAGGAVAADRDFELTWRPMPGTAPTAALLRETLDGADYYLLLLVPPVGDQAADILPREVVFVLDTSGSMAGESIRQAKASLLLALDRLRPADRFELIRFANDWSNLFGGTVDATATNIERAKRYVAALDAGGGTEMLPALQAALADPTPEDRKRVRQVVFLTDGAIGNETALFAEIDRSLGRSRLFTVGIGSAPNGYFMASAARLGRGTYTYVGSESQVAERMAELFAKLERPVMTDLGASWPSGTTPEAYPEPMPDLYANEPVVLAARAEGASGSLAIEGRLGAAPWRAVLDLADARPGRGIAKLWARAKIAALEERRVKGETPETIDALVLETALAHHLVSRLTSLVAIDVTPTRPAGEPLASSDIPLNLPAGWDYDKVFGPAGEVTDASRAQTGPAPGSIEALVVSPTLRLVASASGTAASTTTIALPRTATDAPRAALIGGLLVALGATLFVMGQRRVRSRA